MLMIYLIFRHGKLVHAPAETKQHTISTSLVHHTRAITKFNCAFNELVKANRVSGKDPSTKIAGSLFFFFFIILVFTTPIYSNSTSR